MMGHPAPINRPKRITTAAQITARSLQCQDSATDFFRPFDYDVGRMPPRKNNARAYHHGDLERALIEAGLSIVERDGVEALSLRAAARWAKVSHAAPYHHFRDKSELLAAVAAAGFDQMVAAIGQEATRARAGDALDRLRAVGRGYVLFAVTHPSVFRLMFRPELTRPSDHGRLQEAEAAAFGTLIEAIVASQRAGQLGGRDPLPLAAYAWSTVHGLAMLHIDNVFGETPLGQLSFDKLAQQLNEAIISGLRAHAWA
jgi:AcrR family transcriptional regulator